MNIPTLFDGITISEDDEATVRLSGQAERVWACVKNGSWWTLPELAEATGGSEAAVSARLRDLRKQKGGGHRVDREHVGGGVWRYRLVVT